MTQYFYFDNDDIRYRFIKLNENEKKIYININKN